MTNRLLYQNLDPNLAAIMGYQSPWEIPTYLRGGPYLITRGKHMMDIFGTPEPAGVWSSVLGMPGDPAFVHGTGENVVWGYNRVVALSLTGPSVDGRPAVSALYADYMDRDVHPFENPAPAVGDPSGLSLCFELNASAPYAVVQPGDCAYVQAGMVLDDGTGQRLGMVFNIYDSRPGASLEWVAVDPLPDAQQLAYFATSFGSQAQAYSKVISGSSAFSRGQTISNVLHFGAEVTQANMQRGLADIRSKLGVTFNTNLTAWKLSIVYLWTEIAALTVGQIPQATTQVCAKFAGLMIRQKG